MKSAALALALLLPFGPALVQDEEEPGTPPTRPSQEGFALAELSARLSEKGGNWLPFLERETLRALVSLQRDHCGSFERSRCHDRSSLPGLSRGGYPAALLHGSCA